MENSHAGHELTKDAIASLPTLTLVQLAYFASTSCLYDHYEECILVAGHARNALSTVHGFHKLFLSPVEVA